MTQFFRFLSSKSFSANALTPVYSVLPVLFIMTVTGIKDAYENYRKERSDDEINSQDCFQIDANDS